LFLPDQKKRKVTSEKSRMGEGGAVVKKY